MSTSTKIIFNECTGLEANDQTLAEIKSLLKVGTFGMKWFLWRSTVNLPVHSTPNVVH